MALPMHEATDSELTGEPLDQNPSAGDANQSSTTPEHPSPESSSKEEGGGDGGEGDASTDDKVDDEDDNPRPSKKPKTEPSDTARLDALEQKVVFAVEAAGMYALQFETLTQRIVELEARLAAAAARAFNMPLSNECHLDADFQMVPKSIPGHPSRSSPPEGVDEGTTFEVGATPPQSIHSLFATVRRLDGINHHEQLDAIHWFYNDPRLAHHSGNTVSQRRIALRSFLCR